MAVKQFPAVTWSVSHSVFTLNESQFPDTSDQLVQEMFPTCCGWYSIPQFRIRANISLPDDDRDEVNHLHLDIKWKDAVGC